MKTKRIVISGGPGSGKTTLVSQLEAQGHPCMHEISREITIQAQKEGIEQLFLADPILFSQKLIDGRLLQFSEGTTYKVPILFYDRGMPDVTAYMDYLKTPYPESFAKTCVQYRYDQVFLLPPWEHIYEQDNERYESFEDAEKIYQHLYLGYQKYGYDIYEVPVGSVQNRIAYILENLNL